MKKRLHGNLFQGELAVSANTATWLNQSVGLGLWHRAPLWPGSGRVGLWARGLGPRALWAGVLARGLGPLRPVPEALGTGSLDPGPGPWFLGPWPWALVPWPWILGPLGPWAWALGPGQLFLGPRPWALVHWSQGPGPGPWTLYLCCHTHPKGPGAYAVAAAMPIRYPAPKRLCVTLSAKFWGSVGGAWACSTF